MLLLAFFFLSLARLAPKPGQAFSLQETFQVKVQRRVVGATHRAGAAHALLADVAGNGNHASLSGILRRRPSIDELDFDFVSAHWSSNS